MNFLIIIHHSARFKIGKMKVIKTWKKRRFKKSERNNSEEVTREIVFYDKRCVDAIDNEILLWETPIKRKEKRKNKVSLSPETELRIREFWSLSDDEYEDSIDLCSIEEDKVL